MHIKDLFAPKGAQMEPKVTNMWPEYAQNMIKVVQIVSNLGPRVPAAAHKVPKVA